MLSDNIAKLNADIASTGKEVTVVAATKTVPAEIINLLPSYGILAAGENKVQELLSKYNDVKGITWHFIGRLQRNKVKYIADKVDMIHSVDSFELAEEIEKRCRKIDKIMNVLVEINTGSEASKGGVSYDEVEGLCGRIQGLPHLKLRGLMGVFPIVADESAYARLGASYDLLKDKFAFDCLSAGMSADYMTAIKYGANIIRPGSCLFGQRNYNK